MRRVLEGIIAIVVVAMTHTVPAAQSQAQWDAIYAKQKAGAFGSSEFLAEMARRRQAGRALDIGIGEGRNAFLLASLGWDVTGFDISAAGVRLAQSEAQRRGLRLTATTADVDTFDYGTAQWDLVAGMYMHEMITRNAAKIVDSLRPGGMIVVEGFHRDFNQKGVSGSTYGYGTNELLRTFDKLRVVFYEEARAVPYWMTNAPAAPIVRFAAIKE